MLLTATLYMVLYNQQKHISDFLHFWILASCMWLQKGGTKKDKSNTILFWWATLWKKQINNKSRWPRLEAAMRDLTVSIKIYSTKKRKVWTQTVWQTQISVIHQSVDFSELTSVRIGEYAVQILKLCVFWTSG